MISLRICTLRFHNGVIATALSGIVFATPALAQSYTAFDIGTLGGPGTYATAINATGQVTGNSDTAGFGPNHAFVTQANGRGISDLGTLPGGHKSLGFDINASGQVTGESEHVRYPDVPGASSFPHAFIADSKGGMRFVTNELFSHGAGINDAGQIAGYISSSDNGGVFVTGPNGENVRRIGNLYSYHDRATDINNLGQVVGSARMSSDLYEHAFFANSALTFASDLGTLGGYRSYANGVNDTGQVVGYSEITQALQSPYHAFITDVNSNMTDLGTLGGQRSLATDINSDGIVVGWSETGIGNRKHAFITGPDGTGMTDLNTLVKLEGGTFLHDATGINDRGQIIANGSDGRSYLLSPVPEPETFAMLLAGLGLIGFTARRKNHR